MWPVPDEVSCPWSSVENVTLNTSWEKAFDRNTVFSFFQSQIVSMKSGAPPTEARSLPSGLKCNQEVINCPIFVTM